MAGRMANGRFARGNKASRGAVRGSRHRASLLAEQLIDGQGHALVQKAVEMALGGDASVMRALLDRLVPPRKDRPVMVDLPPVRTADDLRHALSAILGATADGTITPGEASDLGRLMASAARAVEVAELSDRLAAVEAELASREETL